MPLHQYTPGVKVPSGLEPVNPIPIDSWSGPYSAGTTGQAITNALNTIPESLRFLSMEVRILAPDPENAGQTLAYKYWFRGNTATLEEFSSGGGGAEFDASQSYNWTASQYFSSGFSAAGGITFDSAPSFVSGLSASGATLGSLAVYGGISAGAGITTTGSLFVGDLAIFNGNVAIQNAGSLTQISGGMTVFGVTVGSGGLNVGGSGLRLTGGISAAGGATFAGLVRALDGISASGATLGTLIVHNGVSASGGATFANNVYVGGTLSVDGNFYVAGTLTTVNESQLLIQDKYLVLGSTLDVGIPSQGDSAGLYIGSTASPFSYFVYKSDGGGRWVSDKPIYVNTDQVLTSANLSTQTGLTAESLNVLTAPNGTYFLPLISGSSDNTAYKTYVDSGITYDVLTDTLSCTQIEAIIDGGTWSG